MAARAVIDRLIDHEPAFEFTTESRYAAGREARSSEAKPDRTGVQNSGAQRFDLSRARPINERRSMSILDAYLSSVPSDQNALDIFEGDWSSRLPERWSNLKAGNAALFEDPRVEWAIRELGGVDGKKVLELGPLEGGHSYMLEKAGAGQVCAVEGNTRAYLRCLISKEILQLKRVRYLCGDFGKYLKMTAETFDIVFASGVLYHQIDPMQLISDIANISPAVFIWTHYFQADLVAANPGIAHRIGGPAAERLDGLEYAKYQYSYENALEWGGFCGGSQPVCYWMSREDILAGLRHFGFRNISIGFEAPDHPNGPSFALVAKR